MAVLPLILKVVELDTFPEAAAVVMSTIIKLLTNDDEEQFTDVVPLITTALKDEHQGIALSYLRALLKLAADC
ncbi:hypothetical protein B0H14DRAFT_3498216 [Mycena olivaceomarginata]|nr:hypothetical protein B0H14DRAFT_3498216 [Mycena olivaceomarginata]